MIKIQEPVKTHEHDADYRMSRFLRMIRRENGGYLVYHSLFGNASVIDEEYYNVLVATRERPASLRRLKNLIGQELTDRAFEAYYITVDEEEREVTNQILAKRKDKVVSGELVHGLQITSSNACNFSCSYCFADTSDKRSRVRQLGESTPNISFETANDGIEKVLENARNHGRDRIGVKFLGREPLINFRTIDQLFARWPSDQVAWSITTNGALVDEKMAERLSEVKTRVVVSIDGFQSVNDKHREVKNKRQQSAYKLAIRGLTKLLDAEVKATVSSVITFDTPLDQMCDFVEHLACLGCEEVELTLVMQTDYLQIQNKFDNDELVRGLVKLYQAANKNDVFVSGDWINPYHAILANRKFRTDIDVVRPLGSGCQATEHQISLEPDGNLFPCRAMSEHYGSLNQWASVFGTESYRKVAMRTYFNVGFCNGCELEGHCQGTCLGSLEEASGDIYNPQSEYCEVYRQVTRMLLAAT